jgi:hypothetical protein
MIDVLPIIFGAGMGRGLKTTVNGRK